MNKLTGTGVLASLIIAGIIISALNTGALDTFLDLASFLFVFGISVTATLMTAQGIRKRIKVFSRTSVLAGWLGFIIGLMLITGDLDFVKNSESIFPALSVALTPIFYGYTVKLFSEIWLRIIKL
mgnify:CR=1 FL=1